MAIKQIVPILITLQGDGTSTAFTYALENIYQGGQGGSIPFGTSGVVPSSVSINNPPIAVTSSTVDANGNITITFTTAPTNGTQYTLEVDLIYNSGAATSSSPVQSINVNVTGGSITAVESFTGTPGSALPTNAAYIAGKNAGNLIGVAVDSSGNVGVNVIAALPTGANTIGAVTQASGPWTQNLTQVGGTSLTLGSKVSASSIPVVIASDQGAVAISGTVTANAGTGTFTTSDNNAVAQGSTTSGQKGFLHLGAVTTSSPSYTTAQSSPLSLTLAGSLRVDGSAVTQPVSGTVTANAGTGNFTVVQATAASLNATVVQSGTWTTRVVGNTGATLDIAQGGATAATNAAQVAGVYNSTPITLTTGQAAAVQVDASGFLKVNIAAGSAGNGAASATASAVPAQADYTGVNVGGTLRGWTAVNPSGSVYAGQIDVTSIGGSTTATAATGVIKVGIVGNSGAAFDAAQNAAAPANVVAVGAVYNSTAPTITSGSVTQLQTDVSANLKVIEKKDTGRTYIIWSVDAATLITTEALVSIAVNKGGSLQGAATTYTVTTGKTLRIQSISASVQGTNSSVQWVKARVRAGSSVTSSSPVVANLMISNSGATNSIGFGEQDFPDGLEIAGGQQVGVSQVAGQVNGSVTITVVGYEY